MTPSDLRHHVLTHGFAPTRQALNATTSELASWVVNGAPAWVAETLSRAAGCDLMGSGDYRVALDRFARSQAT